MSNLRAELESQISSLPITAQGRGEAFVNVSLQAAEILDEIAAANKPKLSDWLPRLDEAGFKNVFLALLTGLGSAGVVAGLLHYANTHPDSHPAQWLDLLFNDLSPEVPGGTIQHNGAMAYQLEANAFNSQGTISAGPVDVLACQNLVEDPGRMFEVANGEIGFGWVKGDAIDENPAAADLCSGVPPIDIPVNDVAAVASRQQGDGTEEDGWLKAWQLSRQSAVLEVAVTREPVTPIEAPTASPTATGTRK